MLKIRDDVDLKEVKINDLKKYSQVFIKYFSKIFNKENKFIKVIIYPKIVNRFSIFELVICDKNQTLI
jgi:hemerythrin